MMDEARVRRAAGGGELRRAAGDALDRGREHVAHFARRHEKGLAADVVVDAVAPADRVESLPDELLQRRTRPAVVEADVEGGARRAGNDVGGGVADVDGGDLQGRGLERLGAL